MTPAEVLTRAADVIEYRAKAATPGRWEAGERCVFTDDGEHEHPVTDGTYGTGGTSTPEDADHIAGMDPVTALALVPALRTQARVARDAAMWHTDITEALGTVLTLLPFAQTYLKEN